MPGWAMNLHHQLLEGRERNAEPSGELRKGFPIRWTSKELSLSRSTSCLRRRSQKKKKLRLFWLSRICFGTAAAAGQPHNTRDIGQGFTDALPLRGGRCTGAVSQLCTRVATPVSSWSVIAHRPPVYNPYTVV